MSVQKQIHFFSCINHSLCVEVVTVPRCERGSLINPKNRADVELELAKCISHAYTGEREQIRVGRR